MKPVLKTYGPAVASGILLALAFPSWGLFPLAWVALVPLIHQTRDLPPRACAGRFLLAGWVFYSLLLHWLMTNVYWGGGWAFWGYQALCVMLALYWAVLGFLWSWLRASGPRYNVPGALFILWPVMELLQAKLFSGFGWGAIGYSQGRDLLITQWASFGNVVLVSAIVVLCNEFLAWFLPHRAHLRDEPPSSKNPKSKIQNPKSPPAFRFLLLAVAVLLVTHAVGWFVLDKPDYQSKPLNVGILQTDFPIEMKWDWEYSEEMVRNAAQKSRWLAQHEKVDLFVWPEAMVMDEITTPGIQKEVNGLTKETGSALFTGAHRRDEKTGGYRNSSYLIDKDGKIAGFYDKVHLVAFGEYVPFSKYLPFIQKVVPVIGDVEPGDKQKVIAAVGRALGPLICFEVLFTDMAMKLREDGADFLVVITNLGWFGSSAAIPQEFEIARMRAVETRLPLVHCSNTGISGVFDPWGRFTMIDAAFGPNGRYVKFGQSLSPKDTIMQRMAGALPVPAAATHISHTSVAQGAFVIASLLLILAATFRRAAGSKKR